MKTLYKQIYLLLMQSSILVGGQAVIEGVMMRVPGAYATAVRLSDNTIKHKRHTFNSLIDNQKIYNKYFLRGMIHLYESMKIGYATLDWSSKIAEGSNYKEPNKIVDWMMTIISLMFALSLFVFSPLWITSHFFEDIINRPMYFNILSGLFRILIFLIYLILISQLKDIKRLFQYHGAEHKTVYNFESGLDLNVENAQTFSTKHPRCGTSFIFIIMLVTIFTYAILDSIALLFIDDLNYYYRMIFHILCLPLVSGVGYEVLKFLALKQKNIICRLLSKPGLWLQHITTREPSNEQLEISIYALKKAFGEKFNQYSGKKFTADAIG